MAPVARVSRHGADRVRRGHPWVYRSDVVGVEGEPGDLVRVVADRGRPLGWAWWSSQSEIALRIVSTETGATAPDDSALLTARIRAAAAYRAALGIDAPAHRVVHGEADRLPALVVDRYGTESGLYFVIQTLSQATDRRLADIVRILVDEWAPAGVLARNDPKVRRLEGLDERIDVVHGAVPERVAVREGRVTFHVDLRSAQKTGLFLDQRENHAVAAHLARGRALDAFAYHGGFALQMAASAREVLALDSSAAAVEATRENARANGFSNVTVREANVFDELRELDVSGARFDTIVLDPPAFAKNRASVERAVAGYKEINLRAFRLLAPGGHLLTCSCSYHVDDALFQDIVGAAAADARVTATLIEKRLQARDHPVLVHVPETCYLKCLVLRRMA